MGASSPGVRYYAVLTHRPGGELPTMLHRMKPTAIRSRIPYEPRTKRKQHNIIRGSEPGNGVFSTADPPAYVVILQIQLPDPCDVPSAAEAPNQWRGALYCGAVFPYGKPPGRGDRNFAAFIPPALFQPAAFLPCPLHVFPRAKQRKNERVLTRRARVDSERAAHFPVFV